MFNPFSLKDKNILITGVSSGIGRQCAISCSQMGATVVLLGRNEQRLSETLNLLNKGEHLSYSIDLTEYEKIETIISDAVRKVGKIDGFIHAAGIEMTLPLKMLKPQKLQDVFSINVFSAFHIAKLISKKKYLGNNASFVFIASIMAQLGQPGKIGYCSSKGALVAGAKSMALELANKNVRTNSILPGLVKSEMSLNLLDTLSEAERISIENMHPLGVGNVLDVANACIYLLSGGSKWVTGTNLIVDGGYSAR